MLKATGLLMFVTMLGMLAGLAREWLLVAAWGASARTDGFLVAMFIPEAIRMILAAGVLSSATLALWQQQDPAERRVWLGRVTFGFVVLGVSAALVLSLGSSFWVTLVGPGLSAAVRVDTHQALSVLAWSVPCMLLQALWSVPLQARGRFLGPGLSSLIYNLPAVAYLALNRERADEVGLALSFVLGSVLMALLLLPAAVKSGLQWRWLRWHGSTLRTLMHRLGHLLGSAVAGQALVLLERMLASFLGEGAVTVLHLARKLVSLPLIALMSVNQVLLGQMSRGAAEARLPLLHRGLAFNTLVTTPAAVGLMLSAQAMVTLLFPAVKDASALLGTVLGWYSVALVLIGWTTLLARYNYADGETRLPFICEVSGNAVQALAMFGLARLMGVEGLAVAMLLGVIVNGALLVHLNSLWRCLPLATLTLAGAVPLGIAGLCLLPLLPPDPLPRLAAATVAGLACLVLLAAWLRPWATRSVVVTP